MGRGCDPRQNGHNDELDEKLFCKFIRRKCKDILDPFRAR